MAHKATSRTKAVRDNPLAAFPRFKAVSESTNSALLLVLHTN